ncbi:MAG: GPR endopeptidase [Candidatus Spyradocola sp.]|nr:GPR endopeptidase [Candidatus Spyradocola sp.]
MNSSVRTDLAMEAREAAGEIEGVEMEQKKEGKATVTRVRVNTEQGARAIGKPIGTYVTIEQSGFAQTRSSALTRCIGQQLKQLLGEVRPGGALVVGLGNRELTPDSLGPRVMQHILVTRHLFTQLPELLDERVQPVSVLAPGVMGSTGMETGEVVQAVVQRVRPGYVVVVDALAARSTSRILNTVQLTDAGVSPGSGVGNHRDALTRETLGVPVVAVGVPMVVHASTILRDALDRIAGQSGAELDLGALLRDMDGENLVVTPVMIDEAVRSVAALLAEGIDLALQPELSRRELRALRI